MGDAAAVAAGQGGPQRSGSPTSTAAQEARDVQPDWDRILTELALDDRQLHYLVLLRERHQDRLQSLSAARQALSLEVREVRTLSWYRAWCGAGPGIEPRPSAWLSQA